MVVYIEEWYVYLIVHILAHYNAKDQITGTILSSYKYYKYIHFISFHSVWARFSFQTEVFSNAVQL